RAAFALLPLTPPSSPLFPYTTLFRSARRTAFPDVQGARGGSVRPAIGHRLAREHAKREHQHGQAAGQEGQRRSPRRQAAHRRVRSEEHTSELQSPYELVCRLLLEKKK